jgi:hypothetical protein
VWRTLTTLSFFTVSTFTGADCGMAWLATGMAKMTPAETAVTTANALMLNTIRYSFYSIKETESPDHMAQTQGIYDVC